MTYFNAEKRKGLEWNFHCKKCKKDWLIEETMSYSILQGYYKEYLRIDYINYVTCTKCQKETK